MSSLLSFDPAMKQPRNDDAPTTINPSTSASSPTLSLGAIIGITIGGCAILFTALSSLLLRLAKWRNSKRSVVSNQDGPQHYHFADESSPPLSRRLRKRSVAAEHMSTLRGLASEEIGKRIPLPVLPPVFARRQSFHLNPFAAADDEQRKEMGEERELYHLQWEGPGIDEDVLYKLQVSKPKNNGDERANHGISWFVTEPGRTMSSERPARDARAIYNSTLPPSEHEKRLGATGDGGGGMAHDTATGDGMLVAPRVRSARWYTTNFLVIPGSVHTSPVPPSVLDPPSAVTNNVRYWNSAILYNEQILPGSASVTDTELSEVLRTTTKRLRNGNRSPRPQTSQAGNGAARSSDSGDDGRTSTAKSQSNGPTVVRWADLESNEAAASPSELRDSNQTPEATPRHDRRASQVSMISEPDSLVAGRRISQPEHQTALSSPNRTSRTAKPTIDQEQMQLMRPFSESSPQSSPLSTLYSEDEEQDASSRQSSYTPDQDLAATLRTLTAYDDASDGKRKRTTKVPFKESGSPRSSRAKRGTLGQIMTVTPVSESGIAERTKQLKEQQSWQTKCSLPSKY